MRMTRAVFGTVVFPQLKCALGKHQDLSRFGWLRRSSVSSGKLLVMFYLTAKGWHAAPTFCGMFKGVGRSTDSA